MLQHRVHGPGTGVGRRELSKADGQRQRTGTANDPAPHDGAGTTGLEPVDPCGHERAVDATDAHGEAEAGPCRELALEDLVSVRQHRPTLERVDVRSALACIPWLLGSCPHRPASHCRSRGRWAWYGRWRSLEMLSGWRALSSLSRRTPLFFTGAWGEMVVVPDGDEL